MPRNEITRRTAQAPPRAVYRDPDVLQQLEVPLYTDKNGNESYRKIDPDYRNRLSVPFTLSELLSLYFAQDSMTVSTNMPFEDFQGNKSDHSQP